MSPIAPHLHLNGSSRAHLHEMFLNAATAVQRAIDAHHAAAPNARDYYPMGETVFRSAVREHEARGEVLRKLGREYNAILESIQEQWKI